MVEEKEKGSKEGESCSIVFIFACTENMATKPFL